MRRRRNNQLTMLNAAFYLVATLIMIPTAIIISLALFYFIALLRVAVDTLLR